MIEALLAVCIMILILLAFAVYQLLEIKISVGFMISLIGLISDLDARKPKEGEEKK